MPMDIDYDWRFNTPGQSLTVHMENAREGRKIFDATIGLEREEISRRSLARVLLTFPFNDLENHPGDSLAGPQAVAEGRPGA